MSEHCNNCFCCGYYLVPRYKRLVNNIFSQNPQHGLDKNNLERLRFYAVMKPEKLDKSFRYMSEKIVRFLRQRNRPYVILGIKAMQDTMKSCCQQLSTFVHHYLETLRLVLEEHDDLELMEHAVDAFEAYCDIREEAPNYQRNYEFFVDRFTQLCHVEGDKNLRCLGLRGHHALIRKTANDEIQNDLWKHVDKIVPSIVFNMQVPSRASDSIDPDSIIVQNETAPIKDDPTTLAEIVFRDLFDRASPTSISGCVQPILVYLDDHSKWIPVNFPQYIFSIAMNTIQNHNNYSIIRLLLDHLEKHFNQKERANIKTSIMNVLHDCMIFSTTHGVAGSTMFDGIQRLVRLLKKSFHIDKKSKNQNEQMFRLAVIDGISDFMEKLPDFQMPEIVQFIITELLTHDQGHDESARTPKDVNLNFQLLLLRMIQNVTLKKRRQQRSSSSTQEGGNELPIYESESNGILIQPTFPHRIFHPLLKMISTPEPEVRLIILEILQSYVDRRQYADKLREINIAKDISQLGLPTATKSNGLSDLAFMKKFGREFLTQLYHCILMDNNTKDIFGAIYCLMNLVTLEAGDKEVLVDMVHFCLKLQSTIVSMMRHEQGNLSEINHYCIHALIAAYFNIISKFYRMTAFSRHIDGVIYNRERHAGHLLPSMAFSSSNREHRSLRVPGDCLFIQEIIIDALNNAQCDTSRFRRKLTVVKEPEDSGNGDSDESDGPVKNRIEQHRNANQQANISFQGMIKTLNTVASPQSRVNQNQRLNAELHTKPFHELKSRVVDKQRQDEQRVEQLLSVRQLSIEMAPMHSSSTDSNGKSSVRANNFKYPDSFIY